MEKILISRCLLGENCTYRGDSNFCEKVVALGEQYKIITVCPEADGGLPIPRDPAERKHDKVISKTGKDVTAEYTKGAEIALEKALTNNVKLAVMKARSPSCGSGIIYDGTFTGTRISGDGVTAELLKKHGIRVITEEEI
ncbi:MAG: DUF523 domain-containing protein [Oscillospiraceae bacterium]|nr:DUF523 domain-containing protein [Oscillospiraceae bacterium]